MMNIILNKKMWLLLTAYMAEGEDRGRPRPMVGGAGIPYGIGYDMGALPRAMVLPSPMRGAGMVGREDSGGIRRDEGSGG